VSHGSLIETIALRGLDIRFELFRVVRIEGCVGIPRRLYRDACDLRPLLQNFSFRRRAGPVNAYTSTRATLAGRELSVLALGTELEIDGIGAAERR
jgi:hypothetical protein